MSKAACVPASGRTRTERSDSPPKSVPMRCRCSVATTVAPVVGKASITRLRSAANPLRRSLRPSVSLSLQGPVALENGIKTFHFRRCQWHI